ncbi:Uncharacterized protein FWK35_00033981, partial [Aphis craccivora]
NQSLRNLLIDLKLKHPDISYIITRRLNQDIVENLFSYLKAMSGANTHLSPLDFKHCLKWYLLGKHASIALSQNRNTEDTIADNDFLVLEEDKDVLELFKPESETIRTVEHEALEYVVGYVARRFVHKYPDLGKETSASLDSSLSPSWTQHKSRGHLITPSDTLMRVAKVMNKYFEKMHGTSLNKNPKAAVPNPWAAAHLWAASSTVLGRVVLVGLKDFFTKFVVCTTRKVGNRYPKVMETLKTRVILESNDVLPDEVVSCLIRTRTFVRFNHFNKNIANKAPTVGNKSKIRKFML